MRGRNSSHWSEEEQELLKAAAPSLTINQAAKLLGRTEGAVISRAQIMKVKFNVTKVKPWALREVLTFIEGEQA